MTSNRFSTLGSGDDVSASDYSRPSSRERPCSPPRCTTSGDVEISSSSPAGSPSHHPQAHSRQKFNFKSKKISSMLSTLKKFATSPRRRLADRSLHSSAVAAAAQDLPTRKPISETMLSLGRLSQSHPNVSRSDLAALAASAQDDTQMKSAEMRANLTSTGSRSDTWIHRRKFCKETKSKADIVREKKLAHLRKEHRPPAERSSSPQACGNVEEEATLSRQELRTTPAISGGKPFYVLDVCLRCGKNLIARDPCGTSDPYVQFRMGGRQIYRSRTLHRTLEPFWDESFSFPLDDISQPLHVRTYDYDFGLRDDFMGAAEIEIDSLELDKPTDFLVNLSETGKQEDATAAQDLGYLMLTLCLTQKAFEERAQYFSKSSHLLKLGSSQDSSVAGPVNRRQKIQIWDSVVNVVLVKGKNLLPMDKNGLSDPFVKFRLGNEKYRSKFCLKTLSPQWLEQFDLHLYQDQPQVLDIAVWDKDFGGRKDFMGRCSIDLKSLEPEMTHPIWQDLENAAGQIFLLITISGTQSSASVSDLATYKPSASHENLVASKYNFKDSFHNVNDVGFLVVKVFKAMGLTAADLGGKSDPFCVVELINARLQTHTEYKTLCPEWNKIFTLKIRDIHSVLALTVYDEDRDKKVEFLGKLAVPLLTIKNGEKKWYQLKDRDLKKRAKGQILLEFKVVFNPIKACIQTFNPKEVKFMQVDQKFRRVIFMRNVNRVKSLVLHIVEAGRFINSCFQWESVPRSMIAFALFLVITWTAELYMFPLALLIVFAKNYLLIQMMGPTGEEELDEYQDDDDDEERDRPKGPKPLEEKKTLKERLQAVQEITAMIQNVLGEAASLGERVKNTFNFSVTCLSWLAIIALCVASLLLYLVPLRYIILAWGINKFTKKLRNPDLISNNELLDFLSRVPDNEELNNYRELKPVQASQGEQERKVKKRK